MQKYSSISSDVLGILASTACALHCSVLPVLLAMGGLGGFAWMEQTWVEILFLACAVVFAAWSILPAFLRDRSYYLPLIFMVLGLVLLMVGTLNHTHDGHIRLVSVFGGLALIIAHYLNYRHTHQHHFA